MSLATIRAAIKTRLEGVTDIGKVLDYVYWTDDWNAIYQNFGPSDEGRVNVWMIGVGSSTGNTISSQDKTRFWTFNILAYYSIKTSNESSKDFEGIVEGVLNAFSQDTSFVAATTYTPATVTAIDNAVYLGHPVHRAQIQIIVREVINQALCS